MKISILSLAATALLFSSAHGANPFPLVTFGHYSYKSELYNKHELIVSRERGTLTISRLHGKSTKILIEGIERQVRIYFYGNHRYKLIEIKSGKLSQSRKGFWRKNKGNNVIKATSRDKFSRDRSVSDFGIAQRLSVFNLRPAPGYREKYVAHLEN